MIILYWGLLFPTLAIVAGALCFGALAGAPASGAKVALAALLAVLVTSSIAGRSRPPAWRRPDA